MHGSSKATGASGSLPGTTLFTSRKYDLGCQLIAQVAPDRRTRHIVGTGMRMPTFELSKDGLELLGWL